MYIFDIYILIGLLYFILYLDKSSKKTTAVEWVKIVAVGLLKSLVWPYFFFKEIFILLKDLLIEFVSKQPREDEK